MTGSLCTMVSSHWSSGQGRFNWTDQEKKTSCTNFSFCGNNYQQCLPCCQNCSEDFGTQKSVLLPIQPHHMHFPFWTSILPKLCHFDVSWDYDLRDTLFQLIYYFIFLFHAWPSPENLSPKVLFNSLTAIGAHERQLFDKLLWWLVTSTVFCPLLAFDS